MFENAKYLWLKILENVENWRIPMKLCDKNFVSPLITNFIQKYKFIKFFTFWFKYCIRRFKLCYFHHKFVFNDSERKRRFRVSYFEISDYFVPAIVNFVILISNWNSATQKILVSRLWPVNYDFYKNNTSKKKRLKVNQHREIRYVNWDSFSASSPIVQSSFFEEVGFIIFIIWCHDKKKIKFV